MSVLLGSRPPRILQFAYSGGDGSPWRHDRRPQLRFIFFPFLFSHLLLILDWHLEEYQEPSMVHAGYGSWSKEESAFSCPVEE